jgi:hypothetical protein
MRRILVVAHKTLGGSALLEEVRRRCGEGDVSFHLVVPVTHPHTAHNWTDAQVEAEAKRVLDEGLAQFRQLDPTGSVDFTGEVGDTNPVYAVNTIINRGERFDEIILSTLPSGPSRWLRSGVPKRMAQEFAVPITHVTGDRESAGSH